jgi:hypothetical protein
MIEINKIKNGWSWAGIFIIALMMSMPFYSANVYASVNVQVTKNEGEAGLWGFLDAENDVWTVEALFNGVNAGNGSIDPSQVVIKIGNHEAEFKSCTDSPLGMVCEYISPLTDGIKEAEHAFQVIYYQKDDLGYEVVPAPSAGSVIKADGSAPSITGFSAKQTPEGWVDLDFTVNDKMNPDGPSVGIKNIEIIDADSGDVLKTLGEFELAKFEKYNYANDAGVSGKLEVPFEDEGLKHLKIKAEDHLGHTKYSSVINFYGDFIKPEIVAESLNFTGFGQFIGEFKEKTTIKLDVIETNELFVEASSDQADLDGNEADDCTEDVDEDGLWHCTWENVEVDPEGSVSIKIVAKDEYSNTVEKTITKTFTKDVSAPKVDFFGSERTYSGKSFVRTDDQRIFLRVKEQGAGISSAGVRANLGALDSGFSVAPTNCNSTTKGLECYWDTSAKLKSDGIAVINLETLKDNVGNEGELPTIDLVVDNTGPTVKKFEIYGWSGNEDKNYFSSGDTLRFKLRVAEVSGLAILVNMNEVVMDAETKFPETMYTREVGAGWQYFTEDDCNRDENGEWVCQFDTDPIKSGYDALVDLEVRVQDTAGNDAIWLDELNVKNAKTFTPGNKEAHFRFELLALSTETSPDYWEVSKNYPKKVPGVNFIDLDAVAYTHTRMPFNVNFRSTNSQARILAVDLPPGSCVPIENDFETVAAPVAAAVPSVTVTSEEPAEVVGESDTSSEESGAEEPASTAALVGSAIETASSIPVTQSPEISRNLLYGQNSVAGILSPASTKVVLEFPPFDGKAMFNVGESTDDFEEVVVDYLCKFKIYSKVGSEAISSAELQEVTFSVPFAFTEMGSKDENIDAVIKDVKDDIWFQIPDKIKWLNKIIQWVRYLSSSISLLFNMITIISALSSSDDLWRNSYPVYTVPLATTLCGGKNTAKAKMNGVIEKIQMVTQVFSCNPSAYQGNWYGKWQQVVLNVYNSYNNLGTHKAKDLFDNIWVSAVSLCVPGVLYNLEKYRQIKCVQINCLENQVPAGVTTVKGCQRIADILTCKYLWGELVSSFVLFSFGDVIRDFLKATLTNPLGLVRKAVTFGCSYSMCGVSSERTEFCDYVGVVVYLLDILDNVLGMVDRYPTMSQDYCSQVGEGGWS